jgi:hypothetical protein
VFLFQTLYEQGARKFWIHNTGPLGCLPQNIDLWGKDPSQLDEQHCVAKHNRAAKIFNLQLHALCTKLRGQLSGSDITYVDIYSIKYSLVANYSRYGMQTRLYHILYIIERTNALKTFGFIGILHY